MTHYRIFDAEMCDLELDEAERLFKVDTGNQMDSCYFTAPPDEDPETFEEKTKLAMFRKFGQRGYSMIESVEDVTDSLTD